MASGYSLHIGLNRLDPTHYAGWDGALGGCERDAATMNEICARSGFRSQMMLNEFATRQAVLNQLRGHVGALRSGDTLVVTYSGHGSQMTDENGDEVDDADETWCLFDGQMIDDELRWIWSSAAAGARILLVSDSCHSGSIVWATVYAARPPVARAGARLMPPEFWRQVYLSNKPMYDAIARAPTPPASFGCSVVQLAACRDDELALETAAGGNFTRALRSVWNEGNYRGDYPAFLDSIGGHLNDQTPTLLPIGAANPSFLNGQIFQI